MERQRRLTKPTRKILDLLLRNARDWVHGYDIMQRAGISSGTLYPMLIRLSEEGLLDSRWETSPVGGRPQRHAYRLTAKGRTFAQGIAKDRPLATVTTTRMAI